VLGTIDYTYEDDVVLRICNSVEKQKCVVQIGTSDAQRAVNVLEKLGSDVAALDINMGCPKQFSLAGGMGAALLSKPEKAKEREDTLEFVKMLERCGISAIGIHGRRRDERQGDANRVDEIREIARAVSLPIIAKKNIFKSDSEFSVDRRVRLKNMLILRSFGNRVAPAV
ncbi:unnamed protein product, partial [Gongylonema pulchrum]|uniref:Dus domain-containing protein n=1 Tax=Gongylonema pulchrum TaxID=637853 RepID=A0A183E409_9BILA